MAAATKGALECPVFRPTLAEVHGSSFVEYVEKLERSKAFREAGICKIVAPDGWAPRRQGYNRLNFDLPRPIRQHATGRQGLYRTLMVEAKKMRLDEFREMARQALNAAPKEAARGGAGERGEGPTVAEREGWAEELERQFWRNVTLNPPLYGADIPGSLFDPGLKGWSLRRLRSLLSDTLEAHGIRMPGVNEPYLYVGSWRSLFAWHTEDMDLHSVNYLHCGASKQWYVVPPAHRQRLMRSLLQDLFRACPEFMRHKELLVSPQLLASHAIPVVKVVHNPREFVVVFPGAYHSGFNHGFNIAESVNFATKAWLPIGVDAGYCECTADSARIDMRLFSAHMPPKLRREVESMYATSDEEEEGEGSGEEGSSDYEEGSAEESVGSESDEDASASDDVEEEDDDEAPRKRQRRQQPAARQRQQASRRRRRGTEGGAEEEEEAEEEVESTSDWEPEEEEPEGPAKSAHGAGGAAAAAPPAPPLAKPGSPRPQRNRRPPRRDLDMAPVRHRPPHGGAAGAAAKQAGGQRSGGEAAPPNPAAAAASRKRSLARSQQAKAGTPAALGAAGKQNVAVVGTSSRGRPLKLKLLDSLASLLPLGHRR
ncbi:hypothetical protein ABPG75_009531 [Micractinium tetrahymenae]